MLRYLPLTENDRRAMMDKIGAASLDDFYKGLPITAAFDLPPYASEMEVERHMEAYAARSMAASSGPFFLGAGVYRHHIPASVDYIIQRSEFLTSYTPYQPEIAQGTLQVIFEFQSIIAALTGQDVANASMYDGATSCAEAALMAMRVTGRGKVVVGNDLHPHYRDVLKTYVGDAIAGELSEEAACLIVQSPDFFGTPHAYEGYRAACDAVGAKLIVVVNEIISLGLLPAPSLADIVCGEAQSIGILMSFGGPHLGFFACRKEYLRQMPGRLCGETRDVEGRRSFVLTLSTREQHIRREKATSNICTNQGLCALAFTVHAALLGEEGLKNLARLNHERACLLADALSRLKGVTLENAGFFNEFVVTLSRSAFDVVQELAGRGIIAGLPLEGNRLLVTATEMTRDDDIQIFVSALEGVV